MIFKISCPKFVTTISNNHLLLQTYVQDLLKKNSNEIIELLMESQAHFYVCGDISMASDVYRTLEVTKSSVLVFKATQLYACICRI